MLTLFPILAYSNNGLDSAIILGFPIPRQLIPQVIVLGGCLAAQNLCCQTSQYRIPACLITRSIQYPAIGKRPNYAHTYASTHTYGERERERERERHHDKGGARRSKRDLLSQFQVPCEFLVLEMTVGMPALHHHQFTLISLHKQKQLQHQTLTKQRAEPNPYTYIKYVLHLSM